MNLLMRYILAAFSTVLLSCVTAEDRLPSRALAARATVEKRVAADFGLKIEIPDRGADWRDFDGALRAKFPITTTKAAVEHFVANHAWPSDVVIRPYKNFLWIRYYLVEYSPRLVVRQYTVSFRFDAGGHVDGVRLLDAAFYGGWPQEMPESLRKEPNKAPEPTTGAVTPRATEGVSK